MKRPFISELAELGLSGEILSIRTDGMQGTLIPDLTAGVSEAGRVKTGNWVISDKRTFDHVVLCVERQEYGCGSSGRNDKEQAVSDRDCMLFGDWLL